MARLGHGLIFGPMLETQDFLFVCTGHPLQIYLVRHGRVSRESCAVLAIDAEVVLENVIL